MDGNDVLAVYQASQEAVERARRGQGPTLLECLTYRQCGHSRSDPRTYRSREEEEAWRQRDPIRRLREKLLAEHPHLAEQLRHVDEEVEQIIQDAVDYAEASPLPDLSELYTDVFQEG